MPITVGWTSVVCVPGCLPSLIRGVLALGWARLAGAWLFMGKLSVSVTWLAMLELMNAGGGFYCPGHPVPSLVLQLEVRA